MADVRQENSNVFAKPRVALVSGFWGQNIGNAFFNIGGKWILQQVFPDHDVDFIQDQPGLRTFHNQSTGNPKNDIELLRLLDVEYIVLQGPMLTVNFRPLWERTIAALMRRGTRVILLGAALFKHNDAEIEANQRFLREYPPFLMSTRDHYTYEAFKDVCPRIYSGIDSAFFAPKVYQPFQLTLRPYITVNFDRYPEPNIVVGSRGKALEGKYDYSFEALQYAWGLHQPSLQMRFSLRGKAWAYIGAFLDRRRMPPEIGGYTVVRPEHRFNPHMTWKIYRQPNAVASDEPFTYFTVYGGTSLTLSDRVHACVATLAYGKPAMLFTPSPRARLFERLGLHTLRERPLSLDPDYLEQERQAEIDFLKSAVADASSHTYVSSTGETTPCMSLK
jgi:hypothetical protein